MLPDESAERMEQGLAGADRPTLARWLRLLLDDRRERSALVLRQTRQLAYTRQRLKQAAGYLEGLLQRAEAETQAAWPGRLPCPHCGAPATGVKAEQRPQGHEVVHQHPDGVRCEGRRGSSGTADTEGTAADSPKRSAAPGRGPTPR